jgi:hypothetical protein
VIQEGISRVISVIISEANGKDVLFFFFGGVGVMATVK